jgi:hypothetical protein
MMAALGGAGRRSRWGAVDARAEVRRSNRADPTSQFDSRRCPFLTHEWVTTTPLKMLAHQRVGRIRLARNLLQCLRDYRHVELA